MEMHAVIEMAKVWVDVLISTFSIYSLPTTFSYKNLESIILFSI